MAEKTIYRIDDKGKTLYPQVVNVIIISNLLTFPTAQRTKRLHEILDEASHGLIKGCLGILFKGFGNF